MVDSSRCLNMQKDLASPINAPHFDRNVARAYLQSELSSISGRHSCGGVNFGAFLYLMCVVLFRNCEKYTTGFGR